MTRRDFLKLAAGAAVVAAAAPLVRAVDAEPAKEKRMKILVLTGSPRRKGNSNTLAAKFIEGAKEAGHEVFRFDAAEKDVHPCIACNHCGMDGPCVFKDDFEFVREHLPGADCVVFASPMYYFGLSAQLKAVIDRFYAINGSIHVPKKAVLLMTYANTSPREAEPILTHYDVLLNYLGWTDVGRVVAPGVWPVGAIDRTDFPRQAYELGRNLK